MSIKQILILTLYALGTTAFAQTKLIAHKSHSGSSENFKIALANTVFNDGNSNFGDLPERYKEEKVELDSVILKRDSLAPLLTKTYLELVYKYTLDSSIIWKREEIGLGLGPKFAIPSLDSFKKDLKRGLYLSFEMDSVKYKGFDTIDPCPSDEEENSVPFFKGNDNHQKPPFDNSLFWFLSITSLLSLLFALITFRLWQVKNKLVFQYKVQSEYLTN